MKWIKIALAMGCMGFAAPAFAQNCTLASGGLEFGVYDFSSPAPLDTIGTILVNCSQGLTFRIRLDAGRNSGLGFSPRFMQSAAANARIAYNLYIDPSRSMIWGNGDQSTSAFSGVGVGIAMQIPVFGRVFPAQIVPPGAYQDRVTITVEW